MAEYDYNSLYQFLSQTPEQGLRKMLVDPKSFTETHFSLMMKCVRAGEKIFAECASTQTYPKVKLTANEMKLKEGFWPLAIQTLNSRGLLSAALPKVA